MEHQLLGIALEALDAGLCVWPPKGAGHKNPLSERIPDDCDDPACVSARQAAGSRGKEAWGWTHRQHARPTETVARRMWGNGRTGIGVVCGGVSGNLTMFEFEGAAVTDGLYDAFIEQAGKLRRLIERISAGLTERTPSGGIHWYFRCDTVEGNRKLATRPKRPDEMAHPADFVQTLIETRGEGGYSVVAPSHGDVHPDGGAWVALSGSLATIATITPDEYRALMAYAETFDQAVQITVDRAPVEARRVERLHTEGILPGTDFDERTTWADLLTMWGAALDHTAGDGNQHWTRGGKEHGTSFTVANDGAGPLYVFTSSTPLPEQTHYTSKFWTYADYYYAGDRSAAARHLYAQGYGSRHTKPAERNSTEPPPWDPPPGYYEDPPSEPLNQMVDTWAAREAERARIDAEYEDNVRRAEEAKLPVPLERTQLGELIANGVPEPSRVHTWLYAGAMTFIQSEPGVGKSWVALWLAMQLMDAGYVVLYLDEEGGEELIAERLIALGVTPDVADRLFWYFPFPGRKWDESDVAALTETIAEAQQTGPVGMAVLDSLPDFLAAADLSEDSGRDVTAFAQRIHPPLRDAGAALVFLDHLVKPDTSVSGDNKKRGRYARGSGAKLAKAALTILIETQTEFDRERSGVLKVWKTKDRRGHIPLPGLTQDPFHLAVTIDDGSVTIHETTVDAATVRDGGGGWSGPTRCMESALSWLKAHPGEWYSAAQMVDRIIDFETRKGFREQTVRDALKSLANTPEREVTVKDGPRNALLYTHQPSSVENNENDF